MLAAWTGVMLVAAAQSGAPVAPGPAVAVDAEVVADMVGEVPIAIEASAQVNSYMLAGLALGPITARFDPAAMRFYVPGAGQATPFCLSVTSRDGSLTAPGALLQVGPNSRVVRARFAPRLQSGQSLADYGTDDVAIRARIGTNCMTDAAAPYVPAAHSNVRSTLHVMFLSRNNLGVSAELRDGANRLVAKAACRNDRAKTNVRFDLLCSLPLPTGRVGGVYQLRMVMKDRLGQPNDQDFRVFLP